MENAAASHSCDPQMAMQACRTRFGNAFSTRTAASSRIPERVRTDVAAGLHCPVAGHIGSALQSGAENMSVTMDTGTHLATSRPHPIHVVDAAKGLNVTVSYGLSEAGRKASLLSGGDGRARQQLSILVPTARLHLVAVDPAGVARLKLQPRYELTESDRIVRHDAAPVYDAPPSIEDIYRDAARNHELERLFLAQRNSWRGQRREADRERRAEAAREFLSNPSHRAIVHPAPAPKRCFLQTATGRLMFDIDSDTGIAKDVPSEAHRRFRMDLQIRKQRNLSQRAEQLELHEQKKAAAKAWIDRNGTMDQKARSVAGVLALDEVVEAMTRHSF